MTKMADPIVTIEMENGDVMKAELYPQIAPNTVNNFISLVKRKTLLPQRKKSLLKSQNIFLSKRFFTTIPARYLLLPCRQSLYSIQNPCLYCYEISLCCIQIETYSFRLEQL